MANLRLASKETKRIDLGDGEYLDVLNDLSKKEFGRLLKKVPDDYDTEKGFNAGQADDFATSVFETLVKGWSLKDEAGNDVPVTVESYLDLTREAATLVDENVMEHFNSLTPNKEERSKSKGNSK